MQNVLTVVAGYLGKISLPGFGVIDIIEIGLISFFVYQFMAWIKFTRAYTLLKGIFDRPWIYPGRIYLQNEYDPLDLPEPG